MIGDIYTRTIECRKYSFLGYVNNIDVFGCSSWWSGTAGKESKVKTEVTWGNLSENVFADAVQLSI